MPQRLAERADRYPWFSYLIQKSIREGQPDAALDQVNEGERLGQYFLGHVKLTNGRGGALVLERPRSGGVVVALLLDPEEAGDPATALQCGRLREELAREVFPGETVSLQVCRGPMTFGPGDVPVSDVVVTLR